MSDETILPRGANPNGLNMTDLREATKGQERTRKTVTKKGLSVSGQDEEEERDDE